MFITVFLLLNDFKESNLYKIKDGNDVFLKYFFLFSLYFEQHNEKWNSDLITFYLHILQ